jgi:Domain of unknown function (DUF4263)
MSDIPSIDETKQLQPARPVVAFLGVCDRSLYQTLVGHPLFSKIDLYGLCNVLPYPFFPASLQGFEFFFAISGVHLLTNSEIRINLPSEGQYLSYPLTCESLVLNDQSPDLPVRLLEAIAISSDWTWFLFRPEQVPAVIAEPGRCRISFHQGGEEQTAGWLLLEHVPPPPLTPDRIEAILSNPAGLKTARMRLECNQCKDSIRVYTGLERDDDYERQGNIWYRDLPATFTCKCGKLTLDLTSLREHYHGVLGDVPQLGGGIDFTQRYQQSKIEAVCSAFARLVNSDPPEEEVQKFIQSNTILLHMFGPKRIFFKPPILTKYNADIAILNHKKELLLVELERPSLQLLRKDGGTCAELMQPLKQVNDWLHLAEEHRAAVLGCIHNLTLSDVSRIRGVVIAGKDKGYDSEQLRHFKWTDFGPNITVFTYDDLIGSVASLVRAVGNL